MLFGFKIIDYYEGDGDDEYRNDDDTIGAPCQLVPVECQANSIGEENAKGLKCCRKR